MPHPIQGLHHVTATVDAAQPDLDFCVGLLGLRLVKKTVNFDNHGVYHFYYGNESGTPGTIWTTFPYHGKGVPAGHKGAGQVHVTSFSAPAGSIEFWRDRLSSRGVPAIERPARFGHEVIEFPDPSGLIFELVFNDADARVAWTTDQIGAEAAVRGLHSVTLLVRDAAPTVEFMTRVLGFQVAQQSHGRLRLGVNGGESGRAIDVVADASAGAARNGLGTVHHVAMAIPTPADQLAVRSELVSLGYRVTEVMDRQYFQSIYFREPGGVLFEIATMQPGFSDDEGLAELGRSLKLPRWEESNRREIEASLPPVDVPS